MLDPNLPEDPEKHEQMPDWFAYLLLSLGIAAFLLVVFIIGSGVGYITARLFV